MSSGARFTPKDNDVILTLSMMQSFAMRLLLLVFHIIVTLSMIGVILLQKAESMSAGLSSSSGGSMFSARGSKNFLTRTTSVLAAIFLATNFLLALSAKNQHVFSKDELKKEDSRNLEIKQKVR
ncbi:preprotein translocase subunit SecG [Candidatus Hydrogenosomobacter endosymbioticus]|uniref:Protein-export membrane protein SecG n=1 Tax=Candidatus Hydrogenosomobacter endosymbioticus TaxID=2558174 RepID=A0ABN6L3F3_9PROT|nr:preprotein translocase subunit SecG [Candidatus Hydrogenosomobacter endosymbioticus]BDB96445.1 preprotein translocase subunit SecG [Candidatus Hydrogenosomobacter endosymbioticus]